MVKRLLVGLLKGLVVGGIIGGGLQLGLGWVQTAGLLGFLLAMGTAATAGIVCGKPAWRSGAWVEALLKGGFGLGVGALLYWVGSTYLALELPLSVAGAESGVPWTDVPIVYLPVIAGLFGSIVELDNTGDDSPKKKVRKGPRARVGNGAVEDAVLEESSPKNRKKRAVS